MPILFLAMPNIEYNLLDYSNKYLKYNIILSAN
jgi:hypothetical protein